MSYTKPTGVPCAPGETVVQLENGEYIAVQCTTVSDTLTNSVLFTPRARWIDVAGAPKLDAAGNPVTTEKALPMEPTRVAELTSAVVVKEHLLLVLGEPLTPSPDDPAITIIPWGAALVAQCSIRNATAAAHVDAPAAGEVL